MTLDQDLYFISVAARMLGMHPQTLRKYERLGLVQPTRTIGSMRLTRATSSSGCKIIKRLVDDGGINLAGVQRLLSIAEVVQRIRPLMRDEALSTRDARRADAGARPAQPHARVRLNGAVAPFPELFMDFKDYYSTLGVAKTATEKEIKQAYPEAGAQAPSRRQSRRQGRRSALQGNQRGLRGARRSGQTEEIRRAGRELAHVRAGRRGAGAGRPAPAGTSIRRGGQGGGFRTMTEEEMREMFGDGDPVLRLLPHVLRRRGRADAAAAERRRRPRTSHADASRARAATSSRRSSWASRTPITARCGGCR